MWVISGIHIPFAVGVGDVGAMAGGDGQRSILGKGVKHLIGVKVMPFVAFDDGGGFAAHVVSHVRVVPFILV
jgi:hypothetical protein